MLRYAYIFLFDLDVTRSLFFNHQNFPPVIPRRNEVATVESQAVGEPKLQLCTEGYPIPTPCCANVSVRNEAPGLHVVLRFHGRAERTVE